MTGWALLLLLAAAPASAAPSAEALAARLENPRMKVRWRAVKRIERINDNENVPMLLEALAAEEEPSIRLAIVQVLNRGKHRGEDGFRAASRRMFDDLNSTVRTAAAVAVLSYPRGQIRGAKPLRLVRRLFREEQGEGVREEVCTELAKAQAYRDDPGVSRILGSLLTDDPARKVRLAAIQGMDLRGDRRVLRILKKVSKKEKDERVRTEARRVYRRLSKIPKKPKKPKRKPKKGEIKGVDECSNGYGWCECRRGPLKPSPRCVSRDGCIELYDTNYHRLGYRCTWDGQNLE